MAWVFKKGQNLDFSLNITLSWDLQTHAIGKGWGSCWSLKAERATGLIHLIFPFLSPCCCYQFVAYYNKLYQLHLAFNMFMTWLKPGTSLITNSFRLTLGNVLLKDKHSSVCSSFSPFTYRIGGPQHTTVIGIGFSVHKSLWLLIEGLTWPDPILWYFFIVVRSPWLLSKFMVIKWGWWENLFWACQNFKWQLSNQSQVV